MSGWSYILWDLDGTLTDSKPGITKGVQQALAHVGIRVPDAGALECYIGPPLLESFMQFHGLSKEQAQEALQVYRSYYRKTGILEHRLYPGVSATLTALADAGKKHYVATSKPTVFAEKMLAANGLTHLFQDIYGSFLDGRRTAKSEVIAAVLADHALPRQEVVMVGERSHDVTGAWKNGIQVIGVLYGYGNRQELMEAGATLMAESVGQLERMLLDTGQGPGQQQGL